MAATASQIARLRRMVNEPTNVAPYTDAALAATIERYPTVDERGTEPYAWQQTTTAPTQIANPQWIASYDIHAAAADVWEEKAAVTAQDYDFNADGGSFTRSQAYEQSMKQARYHRSRRAVGSIRVVVSPPATEDSIVVNWNNPFE